MDNQKQMEAMALADGWVKCGSPTLWKKEDRLLWPHELPNYTTDNAIDRMVRGLDRGDQWRYIEALTVIVCVDIEHKVKIEIALAVALATAAQKVEAYLKAIGSWVEDER